MKLIRVIGSFLMIGCLVLLVVNIIYTHTTWKSDVQKFAPILHELWEIEQQTDVLYLGDCSDLSTSESDTTHLGVSGILSNYFPEWRVNHISHWGCHAGMYLSLLQMMDETSPVKTVVVTLNLRTFSPASLFSIYENSFIQSKLFMNQQPPLINRFYLASGWYDTLNMEQRNEALHRQLLKQPLQSSGVVEFANTAEWDSAMADGSWKALDGSWDMHRIEAACYAIKDYALILDSLHPRIKDLDAIVELAEQRGWKLMFNLLPENVSHVENLTNSDLTHFIYLNRKFLLHRYRSMGVQVIDNLELLDSEEFIEFTANEHYTSSGRTKLAESVARALNNQYANEGHEISHEFKKITVFEEYNDLEYDKWENLQTLTKEVVHSGNYASKTDAKEPYSLALVKELTETPGNFSNIWFDVTFYAYSAFQVDEVLLVFDIEAPGLERHWRGIHLNENMSAELGKWQKVNYQYRVPSTHKNAKRLKVYVYNNSGKPFYIDDLQVKMMGN